MNDPNSILKPPRPPKREMRIGLVLYGGVSLAIYIYGVTYEFLRLVREEGPYRDLLDETGVKPVIDVVSGTSAGGINGLALGKALAIGADLDSLKRLWLDEADLDRLTKLDLRRPFSVLNSPHYWNSLLMGLQEMVPDPVRAAKTNVLDVFITGTELDGIRSPHADVVPRGWQAIVSKFYNVVFHFKLRPDTYDITTTAPPERQPRDELMSDLSLEVQAIIAQGRNGRNDFDGLRKDRFIAKVAAVTSAFPFAFAPPRFDRRDWRDMMRQFDHSLVETPPAETPLDTVPAVFADGGVIDNKPFSYTLDTIYRRQASGPVDRKLFFIEPKPLLGQGQLAEKPSPNGWEALAAIFGITLHDSITRDLSAIEARNRRINQIQNILHRFEPILLDVLVDLTQEVWGQREDDAVVEQAIRAKIESQPLFGVYQQLKCDLLAQEIVCRVSETFQHERPPQLDLAEFKRQVQAASADRHAFLTDFDYQFRMRRLRYFIRKIDMTFEAIDGFIHPTAETFVALNQELVDLKTNLYAYLEAYQHRAWFIWAKKMPKWRDETAAELLDSLRTEFQLLMDETFREEIRTLIATALTAIFEKVVALRAHFPEQARPMGDLEEMLIKRMEKEPENFEWYIRTLFDSYEFIDLYLYPTSQIAGLGEADPIEVIQVAPTQATRYEIKDLRHKLAGEKFMSFSGFLKRSWRQNDLLWGRLDTVEIIGRTILHDHYRRKYDGWNEEIEAEVKARVETHLKEFLDTACPPIIEAELNETEARFREFSLQIGREGLADVPKLYLLKVTVKMLIRALMMLFGPLLPNGKGR